VNTEGISLIRRILLIKTGAFGDVVAASSSIATAARLFPSARLFFLTSRSFLPVVEDNPLLSGVVCLPDGHNPYALFLCLRHLRRQRFDLVVDLKGSVKTTLYAFATSARWRTGLYDSFAGKLLLRPGVDKRVHPPQQLAGLVWAALGARQMEPMSLPVAPSRMPELTRWFSSLGLSAGRYVLIHPCASPEWDTKRWPETRFADAADRLADRGYDIVLIGDRAGKQSSELVASRMRHPSVNLTGATDFHQLAWLMKNAALLISNDSGPVSVAAACGTPAVVLFGPTDPKKHLPPGAVPVCAAVPCAPCYRKRCRRMTCMEAISVDLVVSTALRLLGNP